MAELAGLEAERLASLGRALGYRNGSPPRGTGGTAIPLGSYRAQELNTSAQKTDASSGPVKCQELTPTPRVDPDTGVAGRPSRCR